MPALSQPVQADSRAVVVLWTPGGLMVRIDADDVPSKPVREALDKGDDAQAARCMVNHTGLPVTVERTASTTCRRTSRDDTDIR